MADESLEESKEYNIFYREVKLMSLMHHQLILKFISYSPIDFNNNPCPTLVTELSINGTLHSIIESEISGLSPDDWNSTKKLINIYGIAYLHSHQILHRD